MKQVQARWTRPALWSLGALLFQIGMWAVGCASKPPAQTKSIVEEGRNTVVIERTDASEQYSHPVNVTPAEVATLLRGVRTWERRHFIHRLAMGETPKVRAFRDDEIAWLAPPLSEALAKGVSDERVSFHLSHLADTGEEETTAGWLYVREPILYLVLTEVHNRHAPTPDISKYIREMPDVPAQPAAFNVTFEPEEYMVDVVSGFRWWSAAQEEEVQIRYRKALVAMPTYPIKELNGQGPSTK